MRSIRRLRVPRRVKYILLEMVVITLGLLLALAIDNLAEWRQQRQTVGNARAALRVELETNAAELDEVMREIETGRTQISANVRALKALLNAADPQDASKLPLDNSLGLTFLNRTAFPFLRETAWLTAQSTSALNYMLYDEVRAYNSIYEAQAEFNRHQRLILDDAARLVGVANEVFRADSRLSANGASELTRCYGSMALHLNILHSSATRVSRLLRTTLGMPAVATEPSSAGAGDSKK